VNKREEDRCGNVARSGRDRGWQVAGSLAVFPIWVYYSSQIFLFGAELTKAYAEQYGSRIVPAENARFISECDPARRETGQAG
jgi:membrane protein